MNSILRTLGILSLSIFLTSGRAHGYAFFELTNLIHGGGHPDVPIFDAGGNLLAGPGYLAQLYVGPDQDSLQPLLPVTFFLSGHGAGFVSPVGFRVENWVGDMTYQYQIRAWDASLGSTYAEAAAKNLGGVGESNIATQWAGGPGGVPALPELPVGLQSFSLSPLIVPEPFTYALLGVGVVALGWQRRRSGRPAPARPASKLRDTIANTIRP